MDRPVLYPWHANSMIAPNERLMADQTRRIGYFVFHHNKWWLVNEAMPDLTDVNTKMQVPLGAKVELIDGAQLLLSRAEGGRLVVVQMVERA